MVFAAGGQYPDVVGPGILEKPDDTLEFWVPGDPVAQPRTKSTRSGHHYTPENGVTQWKHNITNAFMDSCESPTLFRSLRLDLCFYIRRPKGETRKTKPNPPYWYVGKPDKDNLEKSVLDALESVLYANDSQVVTGTTSKIRCGDGCWEPGLQVKVTVLDKYEIRKGGV